jgi:CheY-like chemotaxis protein
MARILVVDDEQLFLFTVAQLLSAVGHEVVTARDGLKAARHWRAAAFDLVITDIFMPERDGIETILALRQEHPEIGIIAMSGRVDTSTSYLGLVARLGACRTLTKPFTAEQLHAAVGDALPPPLAKQA